MSYAELSVFRGPRNHLCASIEGMNLHSKIDPIIESRRICTSQTIETADAVVLYGLGLGYVLEELAVVDSDRPIVLVEPEADWIDQAVALRQESGHPLDLFKLSALSIISCQHADDLVALLQNLGSRNPVLIANPAIQKLRPAGWAIVQEALQTYKARFQVNVNTLKRFGHLWVRNLARNLNHLATDPGVSRFADAFVGFPGLLVAGGPSLDLIIPLLPQLRERMVIVAVDTSLRACLRAGIDPDFVVMVDPQYWNTRHLDGCRHSQSPVISESSVFPSALRQTDGRVYLSSSLFPLGQYFEDLVEKKGALGAGGSVATTAWDFLRYMGIHDVYTAGLDLSFPGGQTHFQGSVFEEACHNTSNRVNPAAQQRYAYLHGAGTYPCATRSGGTVLSDQRMDIYVHWFENQCRIHPNVVSRRIGSGSRQITGFLETSLPECLDLPACRQKIDQIIVARQFFPEYLDKTQLNDRLAKLESGRLALVAELRELQATAARALTLIGQAKRDAVRAGAVFQQAMAELDGLDALVLDTSQRRVAGFLIENLIQEISTASRAENLGQALDLSARLYSGLHEACSFHLDLFDHGAGIGAQVLTPIAR